MESTSPGIELWQEISSNEHYSRIAPLPRLITYVIDKSRSPDQLLEMAFKLCESNLEIGKLEYPEWQGLAIIDATCVFSAEGLGGALIQKYGYEPTNCLRAIASLAKRSRERSQYDQCINNVLFNSQLEDDVIEKRMEKFREGGKIRSLGCMPNTTRLLEGMRTITANSQKEDTSSTLFHITPRRRPNAYTGYGRSVKLTIDGATFVKSPFCCDVRLEREKNLTLYWLASIELDHIEWKNKELDHEVKLTNKELEIEYGIELEESNEFRLRLLVAATAREPAEPGRGARHFWMHSTELPMEQSNKVNLTIQKSNWIPLNGCSMDAYGIKCKQADASLIDHIPIDLVMALEPLDAAIAPKGQISLPHLKIKKTE